MSRPKVRSRPPQSADPEGSLSAGASAEVLLARTTADGVVPVGAPPPESAPTFARRFLRRLIGAPRDLADKAIFHTLSLIPFLAWVGLGADGLSSSAYGPEEAFRALGGHTYLLPVLALAMAGTVFVIASVYTRIIAAFPAGGGGYVVATKLLGQKAGVVSGCALLVDYVMTITISIAAAGDALFSFLPPAWSTFKVPVEFAIIVGMTALNLRGVRESVLALTPVFLLFLVMHAVLLAGGLAGQAEHLPQVARSTAGGFEAGFAALGALGMLKLFVHAYSLGGGTFTGIEAVSNGLPILREPRVETARRTMALMASSLAITAGGLLLLYLAQGIGVETGKTMNAVAAERFAGNGIFGRAFVIVTLLSEGALLVVAAQAGIVAGPRVMANMAVDSWLPRRLAALSDRLTTQNGIVLMGTASCAALVLTHGDVHHLVVMYSINVFLTFSLSMFGMLRRRPADGTAVPRRERLLVATGFVLCATILVVTVAQKFTEGGWITLAVTGAFIAFAFVVRTHYNTVTAKIAALDKSLSGIPLDTAKAQAEPDPAKATAVVMVSAYGGLGIHTVLNVFKAFPGYFHNIVFVSVGVVDSGEFKGEEELAALRGRTEDTLRRYRELARGLGVPAASFSSIGTDAVEEAESLCIDVARRFPRATFFAGQVIFQRERWYDRLLHNQTAYAVQKRLQWQGRTMVILPVRVR